MTEIVDSKRQVNYKRMKKSSWDNLMPWNPTGGMEVYVHSQLSEPYGERDSDGLDAALSPQNIKVARACRLIDSSVDLSSQASVQEGLMKIGKILLQTVRIVESGAHFDSTGLLKVEPH